jgi:hypothetical protein
MERSDLAMTDLPTRGGLKSLRTLAAALGVALALGFGASMLPENEYQRWQLTNGTVFERLRWGYERIHFDPRPVDVAIVGPSTSMLGLSANEIESQLSLQGKSANVVNFSAPATGRNTNWAVINEIYKAKAPKLIVVAIDPSPFPFGHPAFELIAPAMSVISPPAPLLHNWLHDLAYLPSRQTRLFAARFFPQTFGLTKQFDEKAYAEARTDYSSRFFFEGKWTEMEREVPLATLQAERHLVKPSLVSRVLEWCCNDGDDRVYTREIAREANAHGTRLLFVYIPSFSDTGLTDREYYEQFGQVLDNGDLAGQEKLFSSAGHLNHAGAMIASDRVAKAVAGFDLLTAK